MVLLGYLCISRILLGCRAVKTKDNPALRGLRPGMQSRGATEHASGNGAVLALH
jgi:hypothetical protein